MKSTYRLAGHTIKIESLYSQVNTLCAAYRVEDDAEYCITTTPADIAYERKRSVRADELEGAAVREYAPPYLETLAVYRKLAQLLVQDDILLMHGAVVAVDGQAYLFTAKSGTGKTTHTRLWLQQFGDRAVMVNGDKPLLHVTNKGVTAYGTPWDGKEHLSTNNFLPTQSNLHFDQERDQSHQANFKKGSAAHALSADPPSGRSGGAGKNAGAGRPAGQQRAAVSAGLQHGTGSRTCSLPRDESIGGALQ